MCVIMGRQYIAIKLWSEEDRPREKLLKRGLAALSNYELLAILLRSGREGESALDLARRILGDCENDLNRLACLSVKDLMKKYDGVGIAKAASIIVAAELGRRRIMASVDLKQSLCSSIEVYNYIAPVLKDLDHEEFWVIFLSRSNRILGKQCLFSGGFTATMIDVRVVFKEALVMKASAIIIAHNHPSGSLYPSDQDISVTNQIRDAGKLLQIILYDHLIIGGNSYFSFVDENLMNLPENNTKRNKETKTVS